MSLLLKALKQAEASNSAKPGSASASTGKRVEDDFELEPMAAAGATQARDWAEPPGLLFGSSGLTPAPQRAPAFRWPQFSLVPATALLAVLVALGYGAYLYFALQPPAATPVAVPATPASLEPPTARPAPLPSPVLARTPATREAESIAVSPPFTAIAPPSGAHPPSRPAARPIPASRNLPAPAAVPLFQPDAQTAVLAQAYAAWQRGALTEAQQLYTQAAAHGRNVDALLGLAAIASVQNRDADAQRLYREALDLDPRNAAAQAALLDLLGNTDTSATESRLKTLIEREPSAHLHQTLGNLYAEQKRWADAQAAYFEAIRLAPGNADYAFNLAVSLDQLRQFPAALTYYEKALAIGGVHRFDRAQAEARVQQLKSLR